MLTNSVLSNYLLVCSGFLFDCLLLLSILLGIRWITNFQALRCLKGRVLFMEVFTFVLKFAPLYSGVRFSMKVCILFGAVHF